MSEINSLIRGMVSKQLADFMHDDKLNFSDALKKLKSTKSQLSKYDLDSIKTDLEKRTIEKFEAKWGKKPDKEVEKEPKEQEKKPKDKKETPLEVKVSNPIKQEKVETSVSAIKKEVSESKNDKFVAPDRIKYKGDIELNKDHTIKKVKGGSKIAIKCPNGSHGELVDPNTVGCRLD